MSWALLRIWHLEAMASVIASPTAAHFTRTSYLSAPARWRELPTPQLAARVEQVLAASYRQRAAQLATEGDRNSLVPFAFFFEWVDGAVAADPSRTAEPFLYPAAHANPALADAAFRDIEAAVRSARGANPSDAFSAFRVDEDDSWYLVGWRDADRLFKSRHAS